MGLGRPSLRQGRRIAWELWVAVAVVASPILYFAVMKAIGIAIANGGVLDQRTVIQEDVSSVVAHELGKRLGQGARVEAQPSISSLGNDEYEEKGFVAMGQSGRRAFDSIVRITWPEGQKTQNVDVVKLTFG